MLNSPTSATKSAPVADCVECLRLACQEQEPFYKEHEGNRYCVFHFPGREKSTEFKQALQGKLVKKDFNFSFRGMWFPDLWSFFEFHFDKDADFSYAVFKGPVNFRKAVFSARANFTEATFDAKVDFAGATFKAEVDFELTTFGEEADFSTATFKGDLEFVKLNILGTTSMAFHFARIDKSDHVSFHGVWLRPHWFVNVDAHNFNFFDVGWHLDITDKEIENLETKIESRKSKDISSPLRLLAIAYRHLAVNSEENHRYEDASTFRYMAMAARRRETWRGFAFWKLSWWYWCASGYGERTLHAFLVLLVMLFVFAGLYARVGFARWEPKLENERDAVIAKRDEVGAPLKPFRALTYSLAVMTLQKPEPPPATPAAHTVVLLEMILGPIQAALLALAIRRKFMR